jgi:hypothetical protein
MKMKYGLVKLIDKTKSYGTIWCTCGYNCRIFTRVIKLYLNYGRDNLHHL